MNLQEMKKTLKKYKLDLEEVRAYRDLQDAGFDFGDGYIKPESKGSEDAYYEMREQDLEDNIWDLEYCISEKKKENNSSNKKRLNRYKRKRLREKKLKKLDDKNIYLLYKKENEEGIEYYKRAYLSGRKKVAKKQSNKVIRQSRNDFQLHNSGYRKKFEYWWMVY